MSMWKRIDGSDMLNNLKQLNFSMANDICVWHEGDSSASTCISSWTYHCHDHLFVVVAAVLPLWLKCNCKCILQSCRCRWYLYATSQIFHLEMKHFLFALGLHLYNGALLLLLLFVIWAIASVSSSWTSSLLSSSSFISIVLHIRAASRLHFNPFRTTWMCFSFSILINTHTF